MIHQFPISTHCLYESLPWQVDPSQHAFSLFVQSSHLERHDIAFEFLSIHAPPHDPWQLSLFKLQKLATPQLYKFHEQQNSDPVTGLDVGEMVGSSVGKDVGFFVGAVVRFDVPQGSHKEHFAHVHFDDQGKELPSHQLLQSGAFVGAFVVDFVGVFRRAKVR